MKFLQFARRVHIGGTLGRLGQRLACLIQIPDAQVLITQQKLIIRIEWFLTNSYFQLRDLFGQNRFVFVQTTRIVNCQFIFRNLSDRFTEDTGRMGIITIGKQGLTVGKR